MMYSLFKIRWILPVLSPYRRRFRRPAYWSGGDTLVMDWTHGTNNLGYYLGGLVVTSATGRGIPVIDFLALDQKDDTMSLILEFFKHKNPSSKVVRTFVIDKDFTEWRVLERKFPDATVILCQFHALTYWREVCRRVKHNLSMVQRDAMEAAFAKLIYCNTQTAFDSELESFTRACKKECAELLEYFTANWKSCVSMWANHARGHYFTAGNTTANRIESNWNQVKLLLGKRPRLDSTISGLLGHQATIIRQLLTVTRKHATTSQHPDLVPDFLSFVAKLLSDDMLAKVRCQWDLFMVFSAKTTCVRWGSELAEWEVRTQGCTNRCNDLD